MFRNIFITIIGLAVLFTSVSVFSGCGGGGTNGDSTPPEISCPANVTVECGGSTAPSSTGTATATDNSDPSPNITYTDVSSSGQIVRTWRATDNSGNFSECSQIITIEDTTSPEIICPADTTVEVGSSDPENTGFATATDACDDSPEITYSDVEVGDQITRSWTAEDEAGNTAECVQTITLTDYDVRENLDLGWDYFTQSNYTNAIDKFNEVLDNAAGNSEAYLGLGWSHALSGDFSEAISSFDQVSSQPEIVDAYMGLAAVYRDFPNYSLAIENADSVISSDSSYQFAKRTTIDFKDAHLIKAQSYYRLGSGNFPDAHIEVNYLCGILGLDPVPDPATLEPEEYEQALADKIETLADLISD
jgi:hypothetical protein